MQCHSVLQYAMKRRKYNAITYLNLARHVVIMEYSEEVPTCKSFSTGLSGHAVYD